MSRLLLAAILAFVGVSHVSAAGLHAFATISQNHVSQNQDRVTLGGDVTVAEGETAGDIACAFCSVHLHGDVRGDVAVLFGNVTVDQDRSISGDVAMLGGKLSLADSASIGGDLALAGGDVDLSPEATIRGDRMVLPGRLWLLVPFAPLLILIGIVWLIVYYVRRSRYPAPYTRTGRGF